MWVKVGVKILLGCIWFQVNIFYKLPVSAAQGYRCVSHEIRISVLWKSGRREAILDSSDCYGRDSALWELTCLTGI